MTARRVIRILWVCLHFGCGCAGVRGGAETSISDDLRQWQTGLRRIIGQPRFANGYWGIQIVSLDSGRTLFEENPHKLFQPASNTKLFTAAMVLDRLGPEYRIRTSIVSEWLPDENGVVHGEVSIVGRGDPTLRSRNEGNESESPLSRLAAVFTDLGIRRITGKLVGDESFLDGTVRARGWMWGDLEHGYGPRLSALSIDGNTFEVRVMAAAAVGEPCRIDLDDPDARLAVVNHTLTTAGPAGQAVSARRPFGTDAVVVAGEVPQGAGVERLFVPMEDPARSFMRLLAAELQERGTHLQAGVAVRSAPLPPPGNELGSVESPPLLEMLQGMLKQSDNLAAALLFAHAEVGPNGDRAAASSPAASGGVTRFLEKHGLPAAEVHIEEGTGLSHNNLLSPHAVVTLLRDLAESPAARPLIEGLPVAGVDGTLQERFVGTPAQGNLRAKTGTLRWAQALSGYVTSRAGERLAFSILLNRYQPTGSDPAAAEELDAVALHIARLAVRSDHRE